MTESPIDRHHYARVTVFMREPPSHRPRSVLTQIAEQRIRTAYHSKSMFEWAIEQHPWPIRFTSQPGGDRCRAPGFTVRSQVEHAFLNPLY